MEIYLYGAFGRDFSTNDGARVMVIGLTAKQWRALVDATESTAAIATLGGRHGLDLAREGDRYRVRHEVASLLEPWFAARSMAEVARSFEGTGVCWNRYRTVPETLADDVDCSEQNPMFARVEHPFVGALLTPGAPLAFAGTERVAPARAPVLGEHTESVLTEVLGLGGEDVRALRAEGVIASDAR